MRRLLASLSACAVALTIGFPVRSGLAQVAEGDLGIYDAYLAGVRFKENRPDQRVFDLSGESTATFTAERLTIALTDKTRKFILASTFPPEVDKEQLVEDKWITPGQVISYDYAVQSGTGIVFTCFYQTRDNRRSVASFVLRSENTAKAFHNTMVSWLSGNLSEQQTDQAEP